MPRLTKGHDYPALKLEPVDFSDFEPKKKLRPMRNLIHVKMDHEPGNQGLLKQIGTKDSMKLKAAAVQCRVLAIGPEVLNVRPGDTILLEQHAFSGEADFKLFDDGTALYPCYAAIALVERI